MDKKLIKVIWHDAQDHAQKWVDEKDAECFGEEVCEIISVGFLVSKTERYVTIAGDWDATDKDFGRVTKVPVGMIREITEL